MKYTVKINVAETDYPFEVIEMVKEVEAGNYVKAIEGVASKFEGLTEPSPAPLNHS